MTTWEEYQEAEYLLENIREELLEMKAVFYMYEKNGLDTTKLEGIILAYELERTANQSIVDEWNSGKHE